MKTLVLKSYGKSNNLGFAEISRPSPKHDELLVAVNAVGLNPIDNMIPQDIHVANVPIDAAIGWTQEDGTRAHRLAGTTVDDSMAPGPHRGDLFAAAPPASVDLGVRSRPATVGREVVTVQFVGGC